MSSPVYAGGLAISLDRGGSIFTAQLVGAYYMSHAGWCYRPVELWESVRAGRKQRSDVPIDDFETNKQKVARNA